ncbi:Inner membrane protein YpjD [hydrothermal vent metagenome]|uniref:Inner membrane protein YpjD n=1 Tax=hydrothermal vent metagenome TaxID=652676 RepID=A0A3B1A2L6_9ZZZZ
MTLSIIGILFYIAATTVLLRHSRHKKTELGISKNKLLLPGFVAILFHAFLLFQYTLYTPQGLDLSVFTMLSLVSWITSTFLLLVALRQPVECLGMIVFPFAAITLLLRATSDHHHYTSELSRGLETHILLSIVSYSVLSIAAVQSLLLYIQDYHLHNKQPGGFISALPSLETMENLLFKMIGLGFILLTISLITGIPYLDDIHQQHLTHKIILSSIAWVIFAVLLWGRWQFGWRGQIAIRWTLGGFVLLMLAYFGSNIVLQVILQRD